MDLKEMNIKAGIWHIKRIANGMSPDDKGLKGDIYKLRYTLDCLERVLNGEKPYSDLDRETFF
jgi:hypothetical protein